MSRGEQSAREQTACLEERPLPPGHPSPKLPLWAWVCGFPEVSPLARLVSSMKSISSDSQTVGQPRVVD